jgi:hypothetical protein
MSELEVAEPQPDPMAFVEYQIVRMSGSVLVSFLGTLHQAIWWLPPLGMEIIGPCAGRYRIVPGGPWVVRAYYPDGYPGPQGEWPEGAELGGVLRAIP